MYRKYLDPHTVMYDDIEWDRDQDLGRIRSLNRFIESARAYEEEAGTKRPLFQFQVSAELMNKIWEYRPFRNDPPARPFYRTIFTQKIWPNLMRRFVECPASDCDNVTTGEEDVAPSPSLPGSEIDDLFGELLRVCANCARRPRALYADASRSAVRNANGFFKLVVDIGHQRAGHIDLRTSVSWLELWPARGDVANRPRNLMAAIRCLMAHRAEEDATWREFGIGKVQFTDLFWHTLDHADFRSEEDQYRTRITECLLQIATGRDVDIQQHAMTPQVIFWKGVSHTKWNAYVYQMGLGQQDRRCSRIYFCRSSDGTVLNEYCEDAH